MAILLKGRKPDLEPLSLVLDFIGLVLTSIPLWMLTKPIKLPPLPQYGGHFDHSEIESVINMMMDNFGLLKWMRFGLLILGLNMVFKYFIWRKKGQAE
jgi:hypothetical protein